jgi:hypothetical protein
MALGDYNSVFGPFGNVFDPAMGRVMATNPEALIPQFVQQGIAPPVQTASLAGLTGGNAPTASDISSEGALPSANPPPVFPSPAVPPRPGTPSATGVMEDIGKLRLPTPLGLEPSAAASAESMAPGASAPSDFYDLPGGGMNATATPPTESPTPGFDVPLPRPRPDTEEQAAKGGGGGGAKGASDAAKTLAAALTGIKAPPAPPQPQLRPHSEKGGAAMQGNPIASLLAQYLSGAAGPTGAQALRLGQTVGGGR